MGDSQPEGGRVWRAVSSVSGVCEFPLCAQLCHLGEGVLNEKQALNQYLFNRTDHL